MATPAASSPSPGVIDARLNASTVRDGDTLQLTADINGTARADLYVLLFLPGGSFFALGGTAPNTLVPAAANIQLGFAVDVPLFVHAFNGTEAARSYTWYVLLVAPGTNPAQTTNWLGADVAGFSFTP